MTGFEELLQMGELGSEYGTMGSTMDPMAAAFLAGFAGVGIVIISLIILLIISRCFIFKKMGNQWYEAIISGHNLFVLTTNAGKPGRWVFAPLIMLIPIPVVAQIVGGVLSLLVWISVSLGLAKKFGKGT